MNNTFAIAFLSLIFQILACTESGECASSEPESTDIDSTDILAQEYQKNEGSNLTVTFTDKDTIDKFSFYLVYGKPVFYVSETRVGTDSVNEFYVFYSPEELKASLISHKVYNRNYLLHRVENPPEDFEYVLSSVNMEGNDFKQELIDAASLRLQGWHSENLSDDSWVEALVKHWESLKD